MPTKYAQSLRTRILEAALNTAEPRAAEIPHIHKLHGEQREDPYYWMCERDDPAVRAHLEAENAYLENVFLPAISLRNALYDEMLARIVQDDSTVPYPMGSYLYYTRFQQGKEYPLYCRKPRGKDGAEEEVLLDVNTLAEGHKFCNVLAPVVSHDGTRFAFGLDLTGRNLHRPYVVDTTNGSRYSDPSRVLAGDFAWSPDGNFLYYNTKDEKTLRPDKIWRHRFGSSFDADELIYEEKDETLYAHLSTSRDRKWLLIHSGYTEPLECRVMDLTLAGAELRCIRAKNPGIHYSADHFDGRWYLLHNDHAPNFRLSICDGDVFDERQWIPFLDHDPDVLIQGFEVFEAYLVVFERSGGMNRISIRDRSNPGNSHYIEFRDTSYDCWLGRNEEPGEILLRLHYTSMTTPVSTFDYDMQQRKLTLRKESPVRGGFDKENYATEYLQVPARDGTLIPVSLAYLRTQRRDGTAPMMLQAYGSYGISYDPAFSSNALSLLNRGFVLAIAHIRGGKEMGWNWYEQGRLAHKMNSFYDFIDCAEYLVRNQYCSPEHLFARGGSAGGLLMGAVMNLRPDLFCGILAHVPFVDVLTTMADPGIPLTTGEYQEWGNPADPVQYGWMRAYSPFDNVRHAEYPHLLVTTGFSDSQVQYWEPAKWVARLRARRSRKDRLLLFHTNLDAGHEGASGRFERLRELALEYAFAIVLADAPETDPMPSIPRSSQ
ncbi:MAG: S9 family peptidase [Saprospiraceae bacterium]|nr:S9 family peptidase [Saprospiraceae bacterium]